MTQIIPVFTLGIILLAATSLSSASAFRYVSTNSSSTYQQCILDATPVFMEGYARAHSDVFNLLRYNETAGAPPKNLAGYYDLFTGKFVPEDPGTPYNDYIAGYHLGWMDAKKGIYHIDC